MSVLLNLVNIIALSLQACLATGTTDYRKPSTLMWDTLEKDHNGGTKVRPSQSQAFFGLKAVSFQEVDLVFFEGFHQGHSHNHNHSLLRFLKFLNKFLRLTMKLLHFVFSLT